MVKLLIFIVSLPGVGIREEPDGAFDRMLAQVDKRDFTPPTDKAADITTAALRDHGKTRPRITDKNIGEVMRMAESLGRPVIQWVNCWPEWYSGSAEFFLEMDEAQHVCRIDETTNQEYIIFRLRDGERAWSPVERLNGKKSADKIRSVWIGEQHPKPDAESRVSKNEVSVPYEMQSRVYHAPAGAYAAPPVRVMQSQGVPAPVGRAAPLPRSGRGFSGPLRGG